MQKHYSITIPTKPYLKKYIQSLYGSPVVFTKENYFGMSVLGFMDRKFYFRESKELVHRYFDKFSDPMQMYFPRWWMLQAHYGTDLPPQNIVSINKLFEERFEGDMCMHALLHSICGVQIKDALEDFCNLHHIIIDEDISYDALIKKESRTRKNFTKEFIANLSSQKTVMLQKNLFE